MEKGNELIKVVKKQEVNSVSPLHNFVKNNFSIIKKLELLEDEIFESIAEIEKSNLMLGEIDKKKNKERIEMIKKEELELLDKLVENLNKSGGVNIIPDNDQLLEVYDSLDSSEEESEERLDEDFEDMDDDEDNFGHSFNILRMLKERLIEKENNDEQLGSDKIKAIEDDDQKRLKKVRELLEYNLVGKDENNIFNPQKELLKIKISPERRELLKKYKTELGNQILGMGEINHFLESEISKNENIDLDSTYSKFEEKAREYKLSQWQKERYEGVFLEFKRAKEEIMRSWEDFKNKTLSEIIEKITNSGYVCKGKIELENHSIAIVFIMNDFDDFARIYSSKPSDVELDEENYYEASNLGGFHKMGFIFLKQSATEDLQEKRLLIEHEIKHRINEIIDRGLRETAIGKYFNSKSHAKNIEQYFKSELDFALSRAKDEILAYLKSTEDVYDIADRLLDKDGSYNYFDDDKYEKIKEGSMNEDDKDDGDEILEEYSLEEIKKELKNCRLKYENILSKCLEIVDELKIFGFYSEEITGIFQTYNLKKWNNVCRRLKNGDNFLQEMKARATRQLPKYIENVEILKRELKQCQKDKSRDSAGESPEKSYIESDLKYKLVIARRGKEMLEEILSKIAENLQANNE